MPPAIREHSTARRAIVYRALGLDRSASIPIAQASYGTTFPVDPWLAFFFMRYVAPGVETLRRSRYLSVFHLFWSGRITNRALGHRCYIDFVSQSDFFSELPLPGFTVWIYALAVGDYFTVEIGFELRSDVRGLRCNVLVRF